MINDQDNAVDTILHNNVNGVKVIRFAEIGGPEVLYLDEVEIQEPGPDEVRLKIRAIGLNRAEVLFRQGAYIYQPTLPSTLGTEAAGEIEAIGADVRDYVIGDRVSVLPVFSIDSYSLYGESSLAPARTLIRVPDNVGWPEAAAFPTQYATAWGMLVSIAKLKAGQTVLITAASSSVGIAAIQIANLIGARPIALTRHSNKAPALLGAGAYAVVATEEQSLVEEVSRLTDGLGADLVVDAVGGPAFSKLIDVTSFGGLVIVYGALSKEVTPLPIFGVLMRDVSIKSFALPLMMREDEQLNAFKLFVSEHLASGALRPILDRTFSLEQIVESHRYLEQNLHVGKIVVTVDSAAR